MTNSLTPANLQINIPPHFSGLSQPYRYKIFYGGRGGAKSWSFAKTLVVAAYMKKLLILCTREYQNSIADSVYRLLCNQIEEMGLYDWFTMTKKSIVSHTGAEFIFKGLNRSIGEIKSLEGVDICWVEEGQNTSENSWKILIPTIRTDADHTGEEPDSDEAVNIFKNNYSGDSEIWVSFNPEDETDPTYKRFIVNTPPETLLKKVNWSENPHFPEVLNKERLYMLEVDPEAYLHVWEGNCRKISDAQIFRNKYKISDFDEPEEGTRFYYGADFGFSQDPATLIRMWIKDECLYISHEAYGIGIELDHMADFYKQVPGSSKWPIKADNSRPETISHLKRRSFDISGAAKWPGCVEDGIAVLRSFRMIYIHTRCKRTAEEARLYSYKVDPKTEEILPIIIDAHNHCWDGIRYGLDTYIKQHNFFDNSVYADEPPDAVEEVGVAA
jgi:phage terminase large subunit